MYCLKGSNRDRGRGSLGTDQQVGGYSPFYTSHLGVQELRVVVERVVEHVDEVSKGWVALGTNTTSVPNYCLRKQKGKVWWRQSCGESP